MTLQFLKTLSVRCDSSPNLTEFDPKFDKCYRLKLIKMNALFDNSCLL